MEPSGYSDTFSPSHLCHCKRGGLYCHYWRETRNLIQSQKRRRNRLFFESICQKHKWNYPFPEPRFSRIFRDFYSPSVRLFHSHLPTAEMDNCRIRHGQILREAAEWTWKPMCGINCSLNTVYSGKFKLRPWSWGRSILNLPNIWFKMVRLLRDSLELKYSVSWRGRTFPCASLLLSAFSWLNCQLTEAKEESLTFPSLPSILWNFKKLGCHPYQTTDT